MEHGLPLEFPVNSSPETAGTRPTRVVRRSPPLLLFLKKERESRAIKDDQDPDRPRAHEARGLDRRRPNLERKRTKRTMIQKAFLDKTHKRSRRSLNTPPRPRGLHPADALARTHRKSYNATTPVHDSLSPCESDPHSPKGSGANVGYQKQGAHTIND
jgi:hypothetical protein